MKYSSTLFLLPLLFCLLSCSSEIETVVWKIEQTTKSPKLQKPTDIIKFNGVYVTSELKKHRLAFFKDLSLSDIRYFRPKKIGKRFRSPHFFALSRDNKLLITNGWGKSIVAITSLQGEGWQEFKGDSRGFKAPHGICVDDSGWIYVGDSLNSRLVRFKDMKGTDWQVFPDIDNLVSYSRQVVCADNAVWVSNSYENRPGLNPGKGSNVLKITDFSSGKAEIVYANKHTNITGILPIKNQLFISHWYHNKTIVLHDMQSGVSKNLDGSRNELGVPYGLFFDPDSQKVIATYFGDFKQNKGGLAIFSPSAR